MGLVSLATIPVALASLWFGLSKLVNAICSCPQQQRICLLIAHADDEAMFFSPTVIKLANPALNNRFEIICLSKGEDPALRATRSSELLLSAANLGLRSPKDVTMIDDEEMFPDCMTIFWSPDEIAKVLSVKYQQGSVHRTPDLDILITFDRQGISSHANHISLLHGGRHWLQSMSPELRDKVCLYALTTTNMLRKYISILDMPLTLLLYLWRSGAARRDADGYPDRLLMFSWLPAYRQAQRSMTSCHKSQMLWFRYGWIMLSRYISTNDLYRQRV